MSSEVRQLSPDQFGMAVKASKGRKKSFQNIFRGTKKKTYMKMKRKLSDKSEEKKQKKN